MHLNMDTKSLLLASGWDRRDRRPSTARTFLFPSAFVNNISSLERLLISCIVGGRGKEKKEEDRRSTGGHAPRAENFRPLVCRLSSAGQGAEILGVCRDRAYELGHKTPVFPLTKAKTQNCQPRFNPNAGTKKALAIPWHFI